MGATRADAVCKLLLEDVMKRLSDDEKAQLKSLAGSKVCVCLCVCVCVNSISFMLCLFTVHSSRPFSHFSSPNSSDTFFHSFSFHFFSFLSYTAY
jgi:hypothetical protein